VDRVDIRTRVSLTLPTSSVRDATAFISPSQGWVVGQTLPSGGFVIEATAGGGHTWTRQYQAR
jgi:photosystem II stability/assembly factor-like uncharacterized protein